MGAEESTPAGAAGTGEDVRSDVSKGEGGVGDGGVGSSGGAPVASASTPSSADAGDAGTGPPGGGGDTSSPASTASTGDATKPKDAAVPPAEASVPPSAPSTAATTSTSEPEAKDDTVVAKPLAKGELPTKDVMMKVYSGVLERLKEIQADLKAKMDKGEVEGPVAVKEFQSRMQAADVAVRTKYGVQDVEMNKVLHAYIRDKEFGTIMRQVRMAMVAATKMLNPEPEELTPESPGFPKKEKVIWVFETMLKQIVDLKEDLLKKIQDEELTLHTAMEKFQNSMSEADKKLRGEANMTEKNMNAIMKVYGTDDKLRQLVQNVQMQMMSASQAFKETVKLPKGLTIDKFVPKLRAHLDHMREFIAKFKEEGKGKGMKGKLLLHFVSQRVQESGLEISKAMKKDKKCGMSTAEIQAACSKWNHKKKIQSIMEEFAAQEREAQLETLKEAGESIEDVAGGHGHSHAGHGHSHAGHGHSHAGHGHSHAGHGHSHAGHGHSHAGHGHSHGGGGGGGGHSHSH